MIKVDSITKRFTVAGEPFLALDQVSFEIKQGDFVCIAGTSGSGKTTLLNIMAGILSPSSGEILFNDKNIHQMSDRELSGFRGENLGFVYQSFNLIPRLTVSENIRAPLYFGKKSTGDLKKRISTILETVGIPEKANEYPYQLSGGQIQRVAIARALVRDPSLIMADEPTGNLDAATGQEIIDLFSKLNAAGATILVVSHDERFFTAADRTLVLDFGKLVRTTKGKKRSKPRASKKKGV